MTEREHTDNGTQHAPAWDEIRLPELAEVRRDLLRRLYQQLRDRGDNFYHWMTSMYDIGDIDYDPSMRLSAAALSPERKAR